MNETFTITFGDQAENHVGMKKIGNMAEEGFSIEDLKQAARWFQEQGISTKIYDLSYILKANTLDPENAYLLVARSGVSTICSPDDLYKEQALLEKDKKALMRGRIVNKLARHNLCFDDFGVDPNYECGQGTVVPFSSVSYLNLVRQTMPSIIGHKAENLKAEGNYYYDVNKCGIGYHGDSERKLVVGLRLGADMPLCFRWYKSHNRVGPTMNFNLKHGDIYFMSQKAVGTDWKKSKIFTLRHAAGCSRFIG